MAEHIELGQQGENLAVDYLIDKGFIILHRNWRCRHEELDIVAQDGEFLVFIEVKTRRNVYFGMPEESVSLKKQRLLVNAADAYITQFNLDFAIQFFNYAIPRLIP
jgi:putative endonuclease